LKKENIQVLFFEVICDKKDIIEANIRQVKLSSPDYQGVASSAAVKDFLKRIDGYLSTYKSVDDPSYSYVRLINVGDQIVVNNVKGYLPTRIVYYLMNSHIVPRKIYLVRNGRTVNEAAARTDAPLSPRGLAFSKSLPKFLDKLRMFGGTGTGGSNSQQASPSSSSAGSSALPSPSSNMLKIWTSPRQRSSGTAKYFHDSYHASGLLVQEECTRY
jgi:6-phosphofructo-2-kinase / fructose-2,6-biphosphatase 4